MTEPFHVGEIAIQERTGERAIAILNGRLIGDRIPERAATFVNQQQYCVLSWEAADSDLWAILLTGTPGFASVSESGTMLRLLLGNATSDQLATLSEGDPLGALFIELSSRRRLRVNGRVSGLSHEHLHLMVEEAFPNCPKYIQRRHASQVSVHQASATSERGDTLTEPLVRWIAEADTFFVASGLSRGAIDASHRGGRAGFVKVRGGVLHIPDYKGNSMFGTLGNFAVNPRAGLAFIDFARGCQLQLTGDVRLEFDTASDFDATGGTGRWWTFTPRSWIVSPLRAGLEWTSPENSPFNP